MKSIILNFILCLCLLFPAVAQEKNEGIRFFEGTWEEALQKAKKEDKLIFVDCYTVWCGPCANMSRNIFPLKEVGDFFNEHFICMKMEVEKSEEGIAIGKRYDITAYPTFLFVTGEGYLVWQDCGGRDAKAFIALGEKALSMKGNSREERFAKGERDDAFLKGYIQEALDMHQADKVERILDQLYGERGDKLLKDSDYWAAFDCCVANVDSPLSLSFIKNYKKLCKIHGKFAVDQKVRNLYASIAQVVSLNRADNNRFEKEDPAKIEAYFKKMDERNIPYCKELQQEIEFIRLLRKGDYLEAYNLGEKCLANADARMLCNWAALGERMTRRNQEIRTKMAEWVKRAQQLGIDECMKAEAESIRHDLENSPNPVQGGKGSAPRKSIPMRGYLIK